MQTRIVDVECNLRDKRNSANWDGRGKNKYNGIVEAVFCKLYSGDNSIHKGR